MENCAVTNLKTIYKNATIASICGMKDLKPEDIKIDNMKKIFIKDKTIDANFLSKVRKDVDEKMNTFLRTFTCPKNSDVQDFFHNKSLEYDQASKSRTFLILDKNMRLSEGNIAAYFTLSFKHITNYKKKKESIRGKLPLREISYDNKNDILNAILIAQLGKNANYKGKEKIKLEDILTFILEKIRIVRDHVGTNIILIEVNKAVPKLIELYENNGFKLLNEAPCEGEEVTEETLNQLMMLDSNY